MADKITNLEDKYQTLSTSLGSSNTAYQPNTIPTPKDISLSNQMASINKQIDTLKGTQLRNKWYGPSTDVSTEDTAPSDGWLMGGLKALQRPLNAIAGTAQYALGKGTKPSLTENINESMKTGLTFGNILQQEGVTNRWVQIPLGIALDVMFDPINIATMGSSTLLGGIGEGLVRGAAKRGTESGIMGALKAAGTSVESNLARKASTVMNLMPNIVKTTAKLAPTVVEDGTKFGNAYRNITKGAAEGYTNLAEKVGAKAISSAEKYDSLTGKTFESGLNKGFFGAYPAKSIGNKVEDVLRGKTTVPGLGFLGKATESVDTLGNILTKGDKLVNFFKYSPRDASKISESYDAYKKLAESKNFILENTKGGAHFINVEEALKQGATFSIPGKIQEGVDGALKSADITMHVKDVVDMGAGIKIYDSLENAKSLINSALADANLKNLAENINLKDLAENYKVTKMGTTGFQWYDDTIEKLKNLKVGDITQGKMPTVESVSIEADNLIKNWNSYTGVKNIKPLEGLLNGYQQVLSIFKPFKVMLNPGSHVVATLGNFVMGAMMGLPVTDPDFLKSMITANKFINSKLGVEAYKQLLLNDVTNIMGFIDDSPTVFKDVSGVPANLVRNHLSAEQAILDTFNSRTSKTAVLEVIRKEADLATDTAVTLEDLSFYSGTQTKAERLAAEAKLKDRLLKNSIGKPVVPSKTVESMLEKTGSIKRSEEQTGYVAGELTPNANNLWFKEYTKRMATRAVAEPNNPAVQMANFIVNRMPAAYEHIDQTNKLGTLIHGMNYGYTKAQLNVISRTVPFAEATDLLKNKAGEIVPALIKNGEKYYRVSGGYASKVATEAFMNYSAMPDFVKMMRAIPFGAPFFSFPYAMAIKTGKTAINNPAIFNKVGFMLDEMNATRTPQEKMAMEETYNQYLKSPTVMKLFGMWNTDVKNFVPFYQMNMLNPSQRNYTGNSFQAQMMKLSDQFPVLNDPVGGVIKDYFLQPWILSGTGEISQGSFGQPVMPNFDVNGKPITPSLGTRAGYGARAFGEALTPGVASYLGLPLGWTGISPETINMLPSYGARNLANATQGRSSIGAMTKENTVQKTIRSLFGRTGLPAYTLDTTKISQ